VSITEYERHQVFQWCEEAMGPERAAIMMELLPPAGWGDIVTKADLQALRAEVRGEIAAFRAEVGGEIAGLRGQLGGEIAEVRGEIGGLRGEIGGLRGEMHAMGSDLRAEFRALNAETLRTMVVAMVASNATLVGLVFAATQLS
jgi:hypothetical protein